MKAVVPWISLTLGSRRFCLLHYCFAYGEINHREKRVLGQNTALLGLYVKRMTSVLRTIDGCRQPKAKAAGKYFSLQMRYQAGLPIHTEGDRLREFCLDLPALPVADQFCQSRVFQMLSFLIAGQKAKDRSSIQKLYHT